MKLALHIDDKILVKALITQESSRRLVTLGGTEVDLKPVPRRRGAA